MSLSSPPRQLFATTPAERVARARQQFFEEGQRPSGLVSEAVLQSWMRCHRQHPDRQRDVAFDPVTPSRLHGALERSRGLLHAAQPELTALEHSLAGTGVGVLLTDGDGMMLYTSAAAADGGLPARHVGHVGSNLAERASGTTAPGIVAATGQACTVLGGEHYFDDLRALHCAAAPIRDVRGRVAGVLDLTVLQPFGFDAAQLVGLYATTIENALLQAQSREHLVLGFQTSPALLGTPLQGLAGVAADGTVAWINAAGERLAGRLPAADAGPRPVEALFGHGLEALLHLTRHPGPHGLRLANGLHAWVQARLHAHGERLSLPLPAASSCAETPEPEPAPPPTLREHSRKLIEDALAAAGGNIAQAARQLRISRGTLYRRMREWQQLPNE
ncbi:MAG: helix-turn-helix domain-containing protein [Acidovorax sp.]